MRGAVIEAGAIDTTFVGAAIAVDAALRGGRWSGFADTCLTGMAGGTVAVAAAVIVAEAVDAAFAEPTLRIGDADALDNLAGSGLAAFAGLAIVGRTAAQIGGLRCLANASVTGFSGSAVRVVAAAQTALAALAGRAFGTIGMSLANAAFYAEAVFAAFIGRTL